MWQGKEAPHLHTPGPPLPCTSKGPPLPCMPSMLPLLSGHTNMACAHVRGRRRPSRLTYTPALHIVCVTAVACMQVPEGGGVPLTPRPALPCPALHGVHPAVAARACMCQGEEVSFSRHIQPSGSSAAGEATFQSVYKINDRAVSWDTYSQRLSTFGIRVKIRNFLVFQV